MLATNQALQGFFARKNIDFSFRNYFIHVMSFMALGLFSSLLIGSILNTVGIKFGLPLLSETLWPIAKQMTGPAIGVAIAYALKAPPLVLFSATTAGAAGAAMGGPVGAYIAAVIATECGKLVANETKVDILVTPAVTVVVGVLVGSWVGPHVGAMMLALGDVIMSATHLQPLLMGAVVAVLMGMALTLPISSAAIAIMLSLNGLAAGAATVGCCAQMVGFAVMSFRENRWAGVAAQGLGTSMLQMPNIIKNPKIWWPPILTSAILGPVATLVFEMQNTPLGAGMGTSGLVGQIQTYIAMEGAGLSDLDIYKVIIIMHIFAPAVLTLVISELMRKIGWIKPGDLTLNLSSK
ncbi:PTS sugar transporter subunit IID [Photobacterium jeanii]|uniref:PTS sugar transporter subunit IID n=1 Tax=Photobacterium jeanii TaxID=858640 RepID=A0A178K4K6_9GAMM|nr:PTS sugar transporter subunit IIC [Photobacterium jeanii]OAN11652.1 PTS sugar transporter subunit IID [Photobacterium jeanii]PST91174.1 PTS sugar transporter subunit IIC [Photobacterium jeanii]